MANFVSVTRLRLRKWRYLPAFLYYTTLSAFQARRAAGNVSTKIRRDASLVFWTITIWRDDQAMRAFRNRGAHLKAMPRLRWWCDEATYAHWEQPAVESPDLTAAYERLVQGGIVSRVEHPSIDHGTRNFPPPLD